MQVFSGDWAEAFHKQINLDGTYATSGANWTLGKLALVLDDKAVVLHLHEGVCRSVISTSADNATPNADYVISGTSDTWQDVLAGKTAPLMGIMSGKLKLTKGSIGSLMPFAKAAVDLVNSAKKLDTEF
ncbi:MAG: SCP2 sterol-binding domain-containing protein [Chloroflexota bacterium]